MSWPIRLWRRFNPELATQQPESLIISSSLLFFHTLLHYHTHFFYTLAHVTICPITPLFTTKIHGAAQVYTKASHLLQTTTAPHLWITSNRCMEWCDGQTSIEWIGYQHYWKGTQGNKDKHVMQGSAQLMFFRPVSNWNTLPNEITILTSYCVSWLIRVAAMDSKTKWNWRRRRTKMTCK